jgi:hypothetical protein
MKCLKSVSQIWRVFEKIVFSIHTLHTNSNKNEKVYSTFWILFFVIFHPSLFIIFICCRYMSKRCYLWSCRVCWFIGNVFDIYSGAALCGDTTCHETDGFYGFPHTSGRFRDSNWIIPRPLPSKSFSVHHSLSPWHSTLFRLSTDSVNNNICSIELFNRGYITPHSFSRFPNKGTGNGPYLTLLITFAWQGHIYLLPRRSLIENDTSVR